VLATAGFEGPLDWLLDLARSRRIDLARLSIAELIAAFEAALTAALDTGDKSPLLLARWGDWLVMATELTLLRSRLLLPIDAADAAAARAAAERLRQTLLSRAETAQAADWLEARGQVGRDVFLRGTDDGGTLGRKRTGDITALLRACLVALRLPAEAAALYRVPGPPVWSVLDAVARIRATLPALDAAGLPLAAFLPEIPNDAPDRDWRCRTAVSATFLAGLELARDGVAALMQDEGWQPIQIGQSIAATSGQA
jgi:segregation and condensation protein A